MQVRVVINSGSGSVDEDANRTMERGITDAFATAGADCEVDFVAATEVAATVTQAADAGPDAVVVGGGDGSMGTAAGALAPTGVPMAVLPLGTLNHFATDLGMPDDVAGAAKAIVGGRRDAIDLGEVNGEVFVNNSVIGVHPQLVRLREEIGDGRGWGKIRAVPAATWRVLRRPATRRLRITVEDDGVELADGAEPQHPDGGPTWQGRSPFVFIGNNQVHVGPRDGIGGRPTLTGGELWCHIGRPLSALGMVKAALAAVLRGAEQTPSLDQHRGPTLAVDAHGHRIPVALDGEVTDLRTPLHYRIRPGALAIIRADEAATPGERGLTTRVTGAVRAGGRA